MHTHLNYSSCRNSTTKEFICYLTCYHTHIYTRLYVIIYIHTLANKYEYTCTRMEFVPRFHHNKITWIDMYIYNALEIEIMPHLYHNRVHIHVYILSYIHVYMLSYIHIHAHKYVYTRTRNGNGVHAAVPPQLAACLPLYKNIQKYISVFVHIYVNPYVSKCVCICV